MDAEITTRQKLVTGLIGTALTSIAHVGRLFPESRRWAEGVEVLRGVPYRDGYGPQHRLDIYRPADQSGPLPVMLYIHGGGFSLLSKETHWMFGRGFARAGYVVFSIDYTLSGQEPFPAAAVDACAAYEWVVERAHHYQGDASRLVLAGESAGANLALAVTVAQCWERAEPWAQRVFAAAGEHGVARAVLPACGMLQVSDPERYLRMESIPSWMRDRIAVVCRRYLPDSSGDPDRFALADPLRWLETAGPPARPLPPILSVCGTHDPIKDDSSRLEQALRRFPTPGEVRWHEGTGHAFHAFIWTEASRKAWAEQLEFLQRWVPDSVA